MPPRGGDYGSIASDESETVELLEKKPFPKKWDWRNYPLTLVAAGIVLLLVVCAVLTFVSHQGDNQEEEPLHDPKVALQFEQIIDHNHPRLSGKFAQRYYENLNHWQGPGHPIFMIIGGEGPVEGIIYPFISEILAATFGAYTMEPEHRYFGLSYPVKNYTKQDIASQLTPRQALQDAVRLVQAKQKELGCGHRGTPEYCPVMAVGASYSGLLATLIRYAYPDVIDISYSGSPCLRLYDHTISPYAYYDYITEVAERISPGCPDALHQALADMESDLKEAPTKEVLQSKAQEYGICSNLPKDIKDGKDLFLAISAYTTHNFGDDNMFYYPPSPQKYFYRECTAFQNESLSVQDRLQNYLQLVDGSAQWDANKQCHDLHPPKTGENSKDDLWGALWCYLMPAIGVSDKTPWPPDKYSAEDDTTTCEKDYGITAQLNYLQTEFGWDDNNWMDRVTRVLLTNGLNDGWFPLSYTETNDKDSDNVVIMNFENGAHHSELSHDWKPEEDTPDIVEGHQKITELIGKWLDDVRREG